MKLYVKNQYGQKIELDLIAPTRFSLVQRIGSETFYIGNELYHVNNVWAEPTSNSAIAGGVAGGLIGALAGPVGILLGTGLGLAIGGSAQEEEYKKINIFNSSQV